MQFRPLHNRVGIKRIDAEEKPAGGIIIPDTAKEKSRQGENNTNHSAPPLAYQPKRLEKLASIAGRQEVPSGTGNLQPGATGRILVSRDFRHGEAMRGAARWSAPNCGAVAARRLLRLYRPHRV
jgi:Chaperonin 10 Kd subunit